MQPDQPATEIRFLVADDSTQLARLAELDSTVRPHHPLLGAIVEGRLIAAHSLATSESVADPFRHTAEIRSRLARQARQLRGHHRDRGHFPRLRRYAGFLASRRSVTSDPAR